MLERLTKEERFELTKDIISLCQVYMPTKANNTTKYLNIYQKMLECLRDVVSGMTLKEFKEMLWQEYNEQNKKRSKEKEELDYEFLEWVKEGI